MAPFRLLLPKSHYKSPLGLPQFDKLRDFAVDVNCRNLARTEPPLRNEVVKDMLKPRSTDFSLRRTKANFERLNNFFAWVASKYGWLDATIRSTTDNTPKWITVLVCFYVLWVLPLMFWLVVDLLYPYCLVSYGVYEACKILFQWYINHRNGTGPPPPLVLFDLKLSKLDNIADNQARDEVSEEFDSSENIDPKVLLMRYDRLKHTGAYGMVFLGDAASQAERLYALYMLCKDSVVFKMCLGVVVYVVLLVYYYISLEFLVKACISVFVFKWVNFTFARSDLPSAFRNFYRRLPSREYLIM